MKSYKNFEILSAKISPVGLNNISNFYYEFISNKRKGTITYVNIYTLNLINKNKHFKEILNSFDIVHPDGIGIYLLTKFLRFKPNFQRFNWTDVVFDFLKICEQQQWKIYFLGGEIKTIKKAVENIISKFPQIKLVGYNDGYIPKDDKNLISSINELKPDIIWVGMGFPKQEEWIFEKKQSLNCFIFQAVGDVFSELAGNKVRGPKFARYLGLEWFFRMIHKPNVYFKRYAKSMLTFIYIIMFSKFMRKYKK